MTSELFKWDSGQTEPTPLTPSEILTAIKTVDGAGSGLDADLLDGVEGAGYAALADNETITGAWTFSGAPKLDNYADLKDISVPGTPASGYGRLYVNGDTLQFISDNGQVHFAPQTFTPGWTSNQNPQPAIGNGTLSGRYILIGKLCKVWITLVFGSTTTSGTDYWKFSLPFTSKADVLSFGVAKCRDTAIASYMKFPQVDAGTNLITIFESADNTASVSARITPTTPFTWGSGDRIDLEITYEIA